MTCLYISKPLGINNIDSVTHPDSVTQTGKGHGLDL